jgi:hypothetical protein
LGPVFQQDGSQSSSDQSAPGGTPNNPGKLGSDLSPGANPSPILSDAQATVSAADQGAEQTARVQTNREG